MPGRFGGKRVLLTGAASGIGRATAVRLVAEGAAVVAVDVAEDGLAATAAACDGPGRITTALCDVSSESAVVGAVRAAVAALDGLDALVHADTPPPPDRDPHRRGPPPAVRGQLRRDGTGVPRGPCRASPRGGVIVNVASSSAAHGNPYMSAYSASKGAVLAFSLSLAAELVGRGIRVVPVSPGTVATP